MRDQGVDVAADVAVCEAEKASAVFAFGFPGDERREGEMTRGREEEGEPERITKTTHTQTHNATQHNNHKHEHEHEQTTHFGAYCSNCTLPSSSPTIIPKLPPSSTNAVDSAKHAL